MGAAWRGQCDAAEAGEGTGFLCCVSAGGGGGCVCVCVCVSVHTRVHVLELARHPQLLSTTAAGTCGLKAPACTVAASGCSTAASKIHLLRSIRGLWGFFPTVDPNFQVEKGCFKADLGTRKCKIKQIPETPDAAKSFAVDFGWVRNLPRKPVTDVDRAWRIHLIILLFPAMHSLHSSIIISYVQFLMHIRER